ncbi:MAG: tryptophan--tRNA ligase [Acidobacteria bacterium]|nr:tryptophan--tRNA ligase [Acidobacteriota bacterium]
MGELERMTQFKDKSQKFGRRPIEAEKAHFEEIFVAASESNLENTNPPHNRRSTASFFQTLETAAAAKGTSVSEVVQAVIDSLQSKRDETRRSPAERASVGLFTYPVLMAADILLYQTDLVPVGQDQKQHLELSRDLAERFNRDFGVTFKIPEPYIPKAGASIKSLQDPAKKMSKSDENPAGSIFLLDDADTISKKIKRAVTDSGTEITFDETRPAISNLLTIYQLVTSKSAEDCVANFAGKGYGQFKGELADAVVEFLRPFQERVKQFDDETLTTILKKGAERARSIAQTTLVDVYAKMGIGR